MRNARYLKRLDELEQRLANIPTPPWVVDQAFEEFQSTGRLPEDQLLARELIDRALRSTPHRMDYLTAIHLLQATAEKLERGEELPPSPDRCRRQLYHEAVSDDLSVSSIARLALEVKASEGVDVTSCEFLRDEPLPAFGSAGLHVLGFYDYLAQPPNEERARAVYARIERLHDEYDFDDEWWAEFGEAVVGRGESGEPEDPVMREMVAALGDLEGLRARNSGGGGSS